VTERWGDGERAVIALHGWFGSAKAWSAITPHLDTATFSYHFLDYRGYGARMREAGDYTVAEAAADTLAYADEQGLRTFDLIGHSMGGCVMQRVLADDPQRVRSLVGISPVPASGVPFDDASAELFGGAAQNPANRRAIIDFTTGNRLSGHWLDRLVEHSERNSTPEAVGGYLRSWAGTDFHSEIEGNAAPLQVIVGAHDPALGADTMRATFLTWYAHCELVEFADAGHYAIDETPVQLVTAVEKFLVAQ
jgi:pimeloyl-ACP methyl ester carboxylesterase